MAKVFLSFLGLGTKEPGTEKYIYTPAAYSLGSVQSRTSPFVQAAELELLKPVVFDKVIIFTTQIAADTHFTALKTEIQKVGYQEPAIIILSEDMSTQGQWKWFEQILDVIQNDDEITVDLTHGYRSIPIIFSTAINFLQRAKRIRLSHVFYGAFEQNRSSVPIVDMKDFYSINIWADAIERLTEDADARKLAELSDRVPEYQISQINDKHFIDALSDLTNRIRSVDVNYVNQSALKVIDFVVQKRSSSSPVEKLMLDFVFKQFIELAGDAALTGSYDKKYFEIQLNLIRLFNEHRLYMQSFTAMRELVGSIGLIQIPKARFNNKDGRQLRRKYAEIFINMFQWAEEKWYFFEKVHDKYNPADEKHARELIPYYEKMKELGIEQQLRGFVSNLTKYRNGLDHAWTQWNGFDVTIIEEAPKFYNQLHSVIDGLLKYEILR